MGTLKLQAKNGAVLNLQPDNNTASDAKITLPKKSGNIATLEDIQALTDIDANALNEVTEAVEENKVGIEENRQDILELEEEINALAPTFERGQWDYAPPETPNNFTVPGQYFTLDEYGQSTNDFGNTARIRFSNTDATGTVHSWANVKAGQLIELFDEKDGEFLLAEIDEIDVDDYYNWATFDVTVKQFVGGPAGIPPDLDAEHRVRIKVFEIPEVDTTSLMPKSGSTFTGKVAHTKDVDYTPAGTTTFLNLKTFPPKNPSTGDWDFSSQFGVNVDLDHGNSGYNTFKFSNRNGDILTVNGGSGQGAKYTGTMTDSKHLVNKGYVDSKAGKDLVTLHSAGNSFKWNSSSNAPSDNYFTTVSSLTSSNKEWHFKKLWDSNANGVQCKDYQATEGSTLEIWKGTDLLVKTAIMNWKTSTRGVTSMMCNAGGYKPTMYASVYLNTSDVYSVILTNMVKK